MLRWRLPLGLLMIAAGVGLSVLDHQASVPGSYLFPIALMMGLAAAQETIGLLAVEPPAPRGVAVYPGVLLVLFGAACGVLLAGSDRHSASWSAEFWMVSGFAAALLWTLCVEMYLYERPDGVLARLAKATFAIGYAGLLWSFVILLRQVGHPELGVPAIGSLLLVVKCGDIGAYTVGRLVGRHKMAPVLSPGKTWEGAVGAMAGALAGAWLGVAWVVPRWGTAPEGWPQTPWGGWVVFGLAVGIAGLVGDLAESLLKRAAGRKDSSTWMPGFGGVLDLVDSIVFAAPVAYFFWRLAG